MSLSKSPDQDESDDESSDSYPTFERLRTAIEEKGEVMVRMASGDTLELHKHNVNVDGAPWLKVGGDESTHWLNAQQVERYWIHDDI